MRATEIGVYISLAGLLLFALAAVWRRTRNRRNTRTVVRPRASSPAHDWLMTYRPVSQMFAIFVLPELDRRIAAGTIRSDQLPIYVHQLRLVEPGAGHVVELNDEVKLEVEIKVQRQVQPNEPLTLADIDPSQC